MMLALGSYFKGGYAVEQEWKDRVEQLQKQLEVAEVKSASANVEIQTKYIEKTKVVHDIKVQVQKEIIEKAESIDAECVITQDVIDILNKSAKGEF